MSRESHGKDDQTYINETLKFNELLVCEVQMMQL